MDAEEAQNSVEAPLKETGINDGKWFKEEHDIFLSSLKKYGCEWKMIAEEVRTRTPSQVRSHAQKYFNKQQNDQEKIGNNKSVIIDQNYEGRALRPNRKPIHSPPISSSIHLSQHSKDNHKQKTNQQRQQLANKTHQEREAQKTKGIIKNQKLENPKKEKKLSTRKTGKAKCAQSLQQFVIPTFTRIWPKQSELMGERETSDLQGGHSFLVQAIIPKFAERGIGLERVTELDLNQFIAGIFRSQ